MEFNQLAIPLITSGIETTSMVASQQLPATSLVGSVPLVQQPQPLIESTLPVQTAGYFGTTISNPIADDDYRLGRRIIDDFRPTSYKTIISPLVWTTPTSTLVTTTPSLAK